VGVDDDGLGGHGGSPQARLARIIGEGEWGGEGIFGK
jgi:hypothetical protein